MQTMPDLLRLAQASAEHAAQRQAVVARNIAHADTPGYRAQDIPPFSDIFARTAPAELRATRPGHLAAEGGGAPRARAVATGAEAPNGNTVSLEDQMLRAAEARRQHGMALAVYSKSLDILRASMGRIR